MVFYGVCLKLRFTYYQIIQLKLCRCVLPTSLAIIISQNQGICTSGRELCCSAKRSKTELDFRRYFVFKCQENITTSYILTHSCIIGREFKTMCKTVNQESWNDLRNRPIKQCGNSPFRQTSDRFCGII